MKKLIVGLCLALFASLALAVPTLQQVETATNQGRFVEAEGLMAEVVAAKPESAKARYVYAETLARNGKFAKAAEAADRARQLDPKIGFIDKGEFEAFVQKLQRAQGAAPRARTSDSSRMADAAPARVAEPATARTGIPGWIWLAGLAVLAIVLWRGFSRSRAAGQGALATAGGPAAGYGPGGMNPGYGPAGGNAGYVPGAVPSTGRPGSGLLGTGLAVAGGVAGGMLLDQMLHRRGESGADNLGGFTQGGSSSADQAARELENRPVDFGSGDDWDSGGGSNDTGDSSLGGDWD